MFTVRTIADGENYFEPRNFDSEILAEAFYGSTLDRIRREDPATVEITVDLIDGDDVTMSHTFPIEQATDPATVADADRRAAHALWYAFGRMDAASYPDTVQAMTFANAQRELFIRHARGDMVSLPSIQDGWGEYVDANL